MVAVGVLALVGAGSALAKKPGVEQVTTACPGSPAGFAAEPNLAAAFSNSKGTTTYTVTSLQNEGTSLIKYCIYPAPNTINAGVTLAPLAVGANEEPWLGTKSKKSIGFVRPGGSASNILLDGSGEPITIGTATWTTLPTEGQTILLHIAGEGVCGAGVPTCFVVPTGKAGPICNKGVGATTFAYNALPLDFGLGCPPPPSLGFEANGVSEFGDAVKLDTTTGSTLKSLKVDFESFGCENGQWNMGESNPCKTTGTEGFEVPGGITAHIYALKGTNEVGELLASSTFKGTIPYRPSANPTKCPKGDERPQKEWQPGSQWFDEAAGLCLNSLSVPITFDNWTFSGSHELPKEVIWTVQFNTTTAGYEPLKTQSCNSEPGGCGYDSLNVGAESYENAPYAGVDLNADEAVIAAHETTQKLVFQEGWAGFRPLGAIATEKP